MEDKIEIGDIVEVTGGDRGYVAAIRDYGTHMVYFIETGQLLKLPVKREWIKLIQKTTRINNR